MEAGVVSPGGWGGFVRVHWVHAVSCIGWRRLRALGARTRVHWVHTPPPRRGAAKITALLSLLPFVAKSPSAPSEAQSQSSGVPGFRLDILPKIAMRGHFPSCPRGLSPSFTCPHGGSRLHARRVAAARMEVSTSPHGGFHFPAWRVRLPRMEVFTSPHGLSRSPA